MREGYASRRAEQNALFRALESSRPERERVCNDAVARHFLTWPLTLVTRFATIPGVAKLVSSFIDRRWPGVRSSRGGVWGVVFALTLPRWFRGTAYWIAALVAGGGVLTLVFMVVVWPLKFGGFPPDPLGLFIIGSLLNAAWGIGWALFLHWFERMRSA